MQVVLEHIGEGNLAPVKASQRQEIIANYGVGDRMVGELDKGRSRKQNKKHHAVFAKAFDNLPEAGLHQFDGPDHLRQWCYLRVGFRDIIVHYFNDGMTPKDVKRQTDTLIEQRKVYKDKGIYTEIRVVPEGLAWDVPKSWAFTRAQHKAANRVMNAVFELLEELIPGITRKQLLTAACKDAA